MKFRVSVNMKKIKWFDVDCSDMYMRRWFLRARILLVLELVLFDGKAGVGVV